MKAVAAAADVEPPVQDGGGGLYLSIYLSIDSYLSLCVYVYIYP